MSRVGVIACGALAIDVRRIARRRGWHVDVLPVSALHHNRPERIAEDVADLLRRTARRYDRLAVAYAECGTRDALDRVLAEHRVERLVGNDCYDVLAGDDVRRALADEPGTYLLTDFLARTFEHTVIKTLGLDRYPELRDVYFRHYTRVLWLAQRPTPRTRAAAASAAEALGLPLHRVDVTDHGLERQLEQIIDSEERCA